MGFWHRHHKPDFASATSGDELCRIEKDFEGQEICKGCKRAQMLFEIKKQREKNLNFTLPDKPVAIHSSFSDLTGCARRCLSCRIFHRALIQNQVTYQGVEGLMKDTLHPVHAKLLLHHGRLVLDIGVDGLPQSAMIYCSDSNGGSIVNIPSQPDSRVIPAQVKAWLAECDRSHFGCKNLSWSSNGNPTRLLRILSESQVQLIQCPQGQADKLKYMALSYCWGKGCTCIRNDCKCPKPEIKTGSYNELNDNDRRAIREGKTTDNNIGERFNGFPTAQLPATIRDAIALTWRLDIQFIWIDSICIIQENEHDFHKEAPRMQQAYGNAYLTICANSSYKATDGLFHKREAWSYNLSPCRLGTQWLSNEDLSLGEMRLQSPLCLRAWTLQEERLSPRILFWSGQRMYWSCSETHKMEMGQIQPATSLAPGMQAPKTTYWPQDFLTACLGDSDTLKHEAWQDVVESYTRRDLTHASDRLIALSGLAARYHAARHGKDEYIDGLWRGSFAQDLAWSVPHPEDRLVFPELQEKFPSWSWASLPYRTPIDTKHEFHASPHFSLVEVDNGTDPSSRGVNVKAAAPKVVKVRGRTRLFLEPGAKHRAWTEVAYSHNGSEDYSFGDRPEQHGWSVNTRSGIILAYESRTRVVVGRLDYYQETTRLLNGRLDIHCLEISGSAMLLLERIGGGHYRRIGISHGFRRDFFDEAWSKELVLS